MRNRKEYFHNYYQRPEVKVKTTERSKIRKELGYWRSYWQRDYVKENNRSRDRKHHQEKLQKLGLVNRCSVCGWDESVCDIHHVTPDNVIVLCPNHHRKMHRK